MAHRIKCYDIQDLVRKIPKRERIVDEKTFGHVVKAYFRNTVDALFQYNQVYLPYGMGMLRYQVIDLTPYYDVKTGKVRGGLRRPEKFANKDQNINKLVKVVYYKGILGYNPFRFFRFERSRYLEHKIAEMYENNRFDSLFIKKI